MAITKKFVVSKNEKTEVVKYSKYENLKGYDVKPKQDLKIEDMINVNEMVVINQSLIEKLVDKKCKRTLEKILKMLSVICDENNGDSDTGLSFVLSEIERFKQLINYKYKEYMKDKEYKLLLKKLEILESEAKLRRLAITNRLKNAPEKKSKGR